MKGKFHELVNGEKPVLIDFHATWCQPCKTQSVIIKDVYPEVKDKVRIVKIDIDKNKALAQHYQVRGVPTLALFKDGQIVWRKSGVQTKPQLLKVVDEHA